MRYAHNVERVLGLPSQAVALLATMMLRGPQTIGELRINSIASTGSPTARPSKAFLNELAERSAGALVVMLPRLPGARENRWMHLLSGTPADVPADVDSTAAPPRDDTLRRKSPRSSKASASSVTRSKR